MMDGKNDKCHFPCTHSATALPAHSAQVSELTCRRCRITTTIIAIKLVSIWILSPFHTQRSKITFVLVLLLLMTCEHKLALTIQLFQPNLWCVYIRSGQLTSD